MNTIRRADKIIVLEKGKIIEEGNHETLMQMNGRYCGSFYAYLQKEEYEKAQSYLSYLAVDSPERKRKEALIFSKTGKKEEAYRAYEELLFTNYQFIILVLNDLRTLYMKDEEHAMAWKPVDVQNQAARVFEMGKYYEVCTGLDVASWEKDVPKTAEIMRKIQEALDHIGDFSQSRLYQHMTFKEIDPGFKDRLRKSLIEGMRDESYSYMRGNELWEEEAVLMESEKMPCRERTLQGKKLTVLF